MSLSNGIFCISLDFEKFWGLHDVADPDEVSVNLMKVSDIIKRKLEIFENKGIHATWATVGLLLDENPIKTYSYKGKINYEIAEYSPYPLAEKYKKVEPSILSGVDEVKQILNTEHQELASHSFSHLYAIEKGIDRPAFIEDIDDMIYALSKFNSQATSIVFPRNQVNEEWLELLNSAGYKAFRGNQQNSLWSNESYSKESLVKRGRRWSDAYFGKSKTQFSRLKDLQKIIGMINIPATRFLRPVSAKKSLEKRKINKIKKEMELCAQEGYLYHLWWHPHNFAGEVETAFEQLNQILDHYQFLKEEYGFESLNMREISERAE